MEQTDIYKIAITQIPKVGPKALRQLISYCGGLEAVFKAKKSSLLKIPNIGPNIVHQIFKSNYLAKAESTIRSLEEMDVGYHFYLDTEYPARLKQYEDAPPIVFFKGTCHLNPAQSISIVGTRKPSEHGKIICQQLVKDLSQSEVTVVSGLAYGIDTIAHQTCVDHQIPTIGVMAAGFPTIYPESNKKLANKMIQNGALLTEFHPYYNLDPRQFPQRNRVIAMLSDAVVVIESAPSGGSMITANFGNQYHKDVFAIPGRPKDKMSLGCNHLIKHKEADLIENGIDILEKMNWSKESTPRQEQGTLFLNLSAEEEQILTILNQKTQINKDEIHYISKIQISKLSSILLNLEFKGIIKSQPGNKYTVL